MSERVVKEWDSPSPSQNQRLAHSRENSLSRALSSWMLCSIASCQRRESNQRRKRTVLWGIFFMENLQQLIRWMLLKMAHTCPIPIQPKALHGLLEKIFSNCFLISSVCLSLGWDLSSKGSVWFLPFLIVIPNHQIWRPRNTTKDIPSPI